MAQATTAAAEPMVRLERVSKRFGGTLAVETASFDLEPGSFLTILGPSGCGKTTLLRMIAGFIRPDGGSIVLNGRPVAADPPWRRSIGMVFQKLALFPHMTAAQNVAYPLKMRGFPRQGMAERVERYLSIVRLGGLGGRRPHELSGGQQQRVAIARALVFEPDLLLLDEPLAALDRKLREDMQLEFRRIQRELGVTTINVTHDQREALVMSDRILVMEGGRIQQAANPVDTYARPANRFVAGFLGVTNFLPGRLSSLADGRAVIEVEGTPLEGLCADPSLAPGAAVAAAVRAERVRIAGTGATAPEESRVEGEVVEVVFEGDRFVYELRMPSLGGIPLRLFDLDPLAHPRHAPGERVTVAWRHRDLMVFPA
ncbi:ABC transporter ATP-binding protein [Geminicoccaceae bacterium 1502E]|nr:ABC transporter ATP-binding protein [Geminicoccaceae bacterium 1502E]